MSVFVNLTSSEMHLSLLAAKKRESNKRALGIDKDRKAADRGNVEIDIVGIRAEFAVADYFGVAPDLSIVQGNDGGIDLTLPSGATAQVKCRSPRSGRDFALMSTDPAEFKADLGVLVYETSSPRTFEIVATITRQRFLEVAVPMSFGSLGMRLGVTPEQMDPIP